MQDHRIGGIGVSERNGVVLNPAFLLGTFPHLWMQFVERVGSLFPNSLAC